MTPTYKKKNLYSRDALGSWITSEEFLSRIINEIYFNQLFSGDPLIIAEQFLQKIPKKQLELPISSNSVHNQQLTQLEIPSHVSLEIGKNNNIMVTGVRGSLCHFFDKALSFEKKNNLLLVSYTNNKTDIAFSTQIGILYRMLIGVTRGYKEKIKTSGVGYRGVLEEGRMLTLFLGYSHQTYHRLFLTVEAKLNRKNNKINFSGPSWPAVSATAAEIHHLKKPDVYNGKGVRYRGFKLRKKEGKKQSR